MKGSFGTDNIAHFLETTLASKQVKLSEEERTKDFSPPKTPELREEAPYIDHEACKYNYTYTPILLSQDTHLTLN